jgi:hypothetical protein
VLLLLLLLCKETATTADAAAAAAVTATPQPSVLGQQLASLAPLQQLRELELRDAASWALPSSGLSELRVLSQLTKLELVVQSPGTPGWGTLNSKAGTSSGCCLPVN